MSSSSAASFPAGAPADAIAKTLSSLSFTVDSSSSFHFDPPRQFLGHAHRLHLLFTQLLRSASPDNLSSPSVHTAFRGIAADLTKASDSLTTYRTKSRIYVLIHCRSLCSSLLDASVSIGKWIDLVLDSPGAFDDEDHSCLPDLRKKAADLSRDLQHANLRVTENEERVYRTLQKEAEVRQNSKAVQSAIIMDLSTALGFDPSDHGKLAEQIRLLKQDLAGSSSVVERRILISLERMFDSWLAEPDVVGLGSDVAFEEEALIPPFKNFICPLTKEVMREPVSAESLQTYERKAINYWFDRCIEDGRDPTCPVTGQVLRTLKLKPNIGLAGAIEEWVSRNMELQLNSVVQCLGEGKVCSVECIERALDNVYRISMEHPSSRYRVRNAGIVALVVKLLKDRLKVTPSNLRSKAFMVLHSMVKDEESRLIMLDEGITRLTIRCLSGSTEKEREFAVKLLLEFSFYEGFCAKLALEKGALLLLSSMAENLEYPTLSNLAEEVLKNMEEIDENVQQLAAAGRFRPLLAQLCEGTEAAKIKAASLVGTMTLEKNGKEHIARHAGKMLIRMLSTTPEETMSSLQALLNLSTFDDNATILVDFGLIPALTNIIFKQEEDGCLPTMLELATLTLANIVLKSGHWELSPAHKDGHPLQSEFIICRLLELLSHESSKCQVAVLQILYGIVSSPQAADLAASHIRSGNGLKTIIPFLEHPEGEHRIYALRLACRLSKRLGEDLAEELRAFDKISILKGKLLDVQCSDGEKSKITCILANLSFSDLEIVSILGTDLLKWSVSILKKQQSPSSRRQSRRSTNMAEGLVGILLHFAKSHDPIILDIVRENHLLAVFVEQLIIHSPARVKQRAAIGLKYLSESSSMPYVIRAMEPQPHGLCARLVLLCGKASTVSVLCPFHNAACEEGSTFCLLKGDAVKPLIALMNDESTDVQIAAVEALSTLVSDARVLRSAASELENVGLFDAAIELFKDVRPGELQARVIWMVERFLRDENLVQECSSDQALVRALIEAFKHGNTDTKRHAQDALTNLRQLSGAGGRNSGRAHGSRTSR